MRSMTLLYWSWAFLVLVQWWIRWRFAGGITASAWIQQYRIVQGGLQRFWFWVGVITLITGPLCAAFDLEPPALFPVQMPLAIGAILATTAPVSLLVFGASRRQTVWTCTRLRLRFPMLRAGAALNPKNVNKFWLGPDGNLWTSKPGEPWKTRISVIIKSAPLVILDAREMTANTTWELFYLLMSADLPKLIVLGPVQDREIAVFLQSFNGVPVVEDSYLTEVVKAASRSRKQLLEWYERRRHAIVSALQRIDYGKEGKATGYTAASGAIRRFYESIPELIALHEETVGQKWENSVCNEFRRR